MKRIIEYNLFHRKILAGSFFFSAFYWKTFSALELEITFILNLKSLDGIELFHSLEKYIYDLYYMGF